MKHILFPSILSLFAIQQICAGDFFKQRSLTLPPKTNAQEQQLSLLATGAAWTLSGIKLFSDISPVRGIVALPLGISLIFFAHKIPPFTNKCVEKLNKWLPERKRLADAPFFDFDKKDPFITGINVAGLTLSVAGAAMWSSKSFFLFPLLGPLGTASSMAGLGLTLGAPYIARLQSYPKYKDLCYKTCNDLVKDFEAFIKKIGKSLSIK
jgi:hypothetical protein